MIILFIIGRSTNMTILQRSRGPGVPALASSSCQWTYQSEGSMVRICGKELRGHIMAILYSMLYYLYIILYIYIYILYNILSMYIHNIYIYIIITYITIQSSYSIGGKHLPMATYWLCDGGLNGIWIGYEPSIKRNGMRHITYNGG